MPGLILAAISGRNIHSLFARPYIILTRKGLALRQWKESESSTYKVLGQLFLPFRRIGHDAVAWSEFRGIWVLPAFAGHFSIAIINTDWGELKVGRLFHENPDRIAREILATIQGLVTRGLHAPVIDHDFVVRNLPPTRTSLMAVASLALAGFCVFGAIPAVLLGHLSLRAIRASDGKLGGKVMARIGLILGYLELLMLVVMVGSSLYSKFTR